MGRLLFQKIIGGNMRFIIAFLAIASLCVSADARPRHKNYKPAQIASLGAFGAASGLVMSMRSKLGQGRPAGCPRAWCGCALAKELGGGSNRAIDWARHGSPAPHGAVGSIAVARHHVGIISGSCPGGVMLISGNGGRSRYTEICYPASRIIAYRWP